MHTLIDVKDNDLQKFEFDDPFNTHYIQGYICKKLDYRYGCLIITKVNEWECQQIIYGTPKLHYPFNKVGKFNFPYLIDEIQIYEKLDGTNILGYIYKYKDKEFITFKTRITPTLLDGVYGSFYQMWNELIKKNSWIIQTIKDNPQYNISFEMYGKRNPILIDYDVLLDTKILFGIHKETHEIIPPTELKIQNTSQYSNILLLDGSNTIDMYLRARSISYQKIKNSNTYTTEGHVFYVHTDSKWVMYKCKPEQIEAIHWANGGIGKNIIWTTILNCFEEYSYPTVENVIELLKEEFTDHQLKGIDERVEKLLKDAYIHQRKVSKINNIWELAEEKGFDIRKNKNETMKFVSQYFDKSEMKFVGTIILRQVGLI